MFINGNVATLSVVALIFAAAATPGGTPFDTGLPVIEIITRDSAAVTSKTVYTDMTFKLSYPDTDTADINVSGRIRGRGNDSWVSRWARKKSYRVNLTDKASLFGLEPARNWTLLAQHRDETLLYNAIPFELGRRFGMRFNHSVNFADLYLNGEYMGNYLVTEHREVAAGRVDINRRGYGWFAEIDEYFDEEPKFRTVYYNLPVMIKFPRRRVACDLSDSVSLAVHKRVKRDMDALAFALASPYFPESGYREMIDVESFIAFLMINEIAANTDLSHPRSSFIYRDSGAPISMGPLWDFDSGYGWNYRNWLESGFNDHFNSPERRPPTHAFFRRFYDDPMFLARYKETWNERYDAIASMTDYIDIMAKRLERSARINFQNWWYKTYAPFTNTRPPMPVDYSASIARLKTWYAARVYYLDVEFNKVDVIPRSRNFGTDTACAVPPPAKRFTLVSMGEISAPSARLQKGLKSPFEIVDTKFVQMPTGRGAYIAPFVTVQPKVALPAEHYHDSLVITVKNRGCIVTTTIPLDYTVVHPPTPILSETDPPTRKRQRHRRHQRRR